MERSNESPSSFGTRETPQDKHKSSMFTAIQDKEYRQYVIKMQSMGEEPLTKPEWYRKIYKNNSKKRRREED